MVRVVLHSTRENSWSCAHKMGFARSAGCPQSSESDRISHCGWKMLLSSNPPHLHAGVLGSPRKALRRTCHHWSCASCVSLRGTEVSFVPRTLRLEGDRQEKVANGPTVTFVQSGGATGRSQCSSCTSGQGVSSPGISFLAQVGASPSFAFAKHGLATALSSVKGDRSSPGQCYDW